jgi:hypothetical protein
MLSACFFSTFLAGCGSDSGGSTGPDIGGVYQVTHHTENTTACDVEGPDVTDPPYFQLEPGEFLGQKYYSFNECTAADPTTCSGAGLFSSVFWTNGEWKGELYAASGGLNGSPCSLQAVIVTVTTTSAGIHIETRKSSQDDPALSGDACSSEEAHQRAATMPCTERTVYEGTRTP